MKGHNLNSLKALIPNKSKWNNSETVIIRVPKILKNEILNYAKKLDNNHVNNDYNSTVTLELKKILAKINAKEKGYKSNGSGQLIADLRELISM
ncbi:hypothetical protein [Geminocystis sp. NIES-3709]|uniref:hypothetical protein n=1 Tax=Geminocystis sp. NIES-3709 TaxID=1617448 RepID=UPI0005FC9EDB|nr:hypothetical protein [Geminocystis sp. NIES-3709]BAQ66467.1 hypothetical protein GM3709_3232 [Geminocystis sp. NIES-3709]